MAGAMTDFYRTQAARAQSEADQAVLSNVRERCLRAVAAWTSMADRGEAVETLRSAREAKHD
jgi:hypothetical protein